MYNIFFLSFVMKVW